MGPRLLVGFACLLLAGCDDGHHVATGVDRGASADGGRQTDMETAALDQEVPPDRALADSGAAVDARPIDARSVDAAPLDAARSDTPDVVVPDQGVDACVPREACPVRGCGPHPDSCGGRIACGGCPARDAVCVDGQCVAEDEDLIVERVGEFFVADVPGARETIRLEPGPAYARLTIDMFATHGGWREDLFDREILSHNLWGLSRIANRSVDRYLLGVGAQIRTVQADLRRRMLFYARVDLEPRPQGQGHEGYTAFRGDFPWTVGTTYRLRAVLDVTAREQRLEVMVDGAVVARLAGPIEYITPALTTSGFTLDFAGDETDHRDVTPVGWRFSDLRVSGRLAR